MQWKKNKQTLETKNYEKKKIVILFARLLFPYLLTWETNGLNYKENLAMKRKKTNQQLP